MRTAVYIIVFIVLAIGIAATIRFTNIGKAVIGKPGKAENKKAEKGNKQTAQGGANIRVTEKYELPEILKEISALVYLDAERFACVQDEVGKIFIYNISTSKIEKEIEFAGPGDYEGLAIAGNTAFVLRADGYIIEVRDYAGRAKSTVVHKTHLTAKENPEGLFYDNKNERLLVAIKDSEPQSGDFKGIYSMSLSDYQMNKEPVYKIDLTHPELAKLKGKKAGIQMQPSAMAIHPQSGDIYITEGTKPKLLILGPNGAFKSVKKLGSKEFNQPEGITFSPDGQLFISNEGGKGAGNILKVDISAP